jgi:NAD(P)-dependent dehydrogenase (short-subunit alcohol dehydrogenase family)
MEKTKLNISKIAEKLLSLEGKVTIISGGASGIGLGTGKRLAELGSKVVVLDINEELGFQAVKDIEASGGDAIFIKCDVTDKNDCKHAADKTIEAFGKIDILFNNAGIAIRKNAVDLEPEEWDLALNVSLKGQYLLSKFVIPCMQKNGGGSIINTGSGWSFRGGENAVAYCAMKGGTLNMTRAMCIDHGKDNIRVNTVCPGDIDTPMLQSECEQLGGTYDEKYKAECSERPLARLGTVEDVANVVLFLASDMSSWISGANIIVDGGGIA